MTYTDEDIAKMDAQSAPVPTKAPKIYTDDDIAAMDSGAQNDTRKPFYSAMGAEMTPEEKVAHPILAGIHQTAQDVGTLAEKTANGLTLGGLNYGLDKAGIKPPDFENTAPENKSGLNLMGDVASLEGGSRALGVVGNKVIAPAAKALGKAIPEGLKQYSYGLMQSIVNQLPKEFKYGANAGRAMVKEGFSGDAAAIKEQADKRIEEIGSQGDALASASNKPVNNSNAMKVIEDKIAELQDSSPRTSAGTIKKLQDAKDDLLKVREGEILDPTTGEKVKMRSQDITPDNMTAKETLDLKRAFDDQTAWKGTASDDTVFNKTMQQARTKLKDNLNDAAPGMKEWNQRYADLRAAQQAAGRTATRDQAGSGISNAINNFVRGSVGLSTFGAMITGHGELAGEILAGGIGKEIISNPYLKSKLAQGLYSLSEADKAAIFRAVPWLKNKISDLNKGSSYTPVDAELVNKGMPTDSPTGLPSPPNATGIPDKSINMGPTSRTGVNPNTSMGGLPNPGPIKQGGYVPRGLPDKSIQMGPTTRTGVDRPYENVGLPSPAKAGNSTIYQGTTYTPVEKAILDSKPYTDFGRQIQDQIKKKYEIPLHPSEDVQSGINKVFPPVKSGNPNIHMADVQDFNNMRDWESYQQKGGNIISGGKQSGSSREISSSNSGHSKAIQAIGGPKKAFEIMNKAANGEKMTTGEKMSLKRMMADYKKNIKPGIEGKGSLPMFDNPTEWTD